MHFLSHDGARLRAEGTPGLFLSVVCSCGVQILPAGPDFPGAGHGCWSRLGGEGAGGSVQGSRVVTLWCPPECLELLAYAHVAVRLECGVPRWVVTLRSSPAWRLQGLGGGEWGRERSCRGPRGPQVRQKGLADCG